MTERRLLNGCDGRSRQLLPKMRWAPLVLAASLGACNSGSNDSSTTPANATPANATPAETIRSMEASGALPVLDRSASLAAPDADGNGVRDDVERYIAQLPDAQVEKRALTQLSRALSAAITADTANDAQLRAAGGALVDSINCVWRVYPAEVASDKVEAIRKVTINTRERFEAYGRYNRARSGSVVTLESGDTCK